MGNVRQPLRVPSTPSHAPASAAPNGTYMAWLAKDLAAAAADPTIKWILAGGHRPFEDLPTAHANELLALFKQYGVAMYFAGHGHS